MSQPEAPKPKLVPLRAVKSIIGGISNSRIRNHLRARLSALPVTETTSSPDDGLLKMVESQLGIEEPKGKRANRVMTVIYEIRKLQEKPTTLSKRPFGNGEEIAEAIRSAFEAAGVDTDKLSPFQRRQIVLDLQDKGIKTNDTQTTPWLEK